MVPVDRRRHNPAPRAGPPRADARAGPPRADVRAGPADPEADLGAGLEAREHFRAVAAPAAAARLRGIGVAHLISDLGCADGVSVASLLARSRRIGSFSKDPVQSPALPALRWFGPTGPKPAEALRCSKSLAVRDTSAGGILGPIYVADWLEFDKNAWHSC